MVQRRAEREQGTLVRDGKPRRQGELPIDDGRDRADPIVPLASNATALRWERLAPGPDFAAARPEQRLAQQVDLLDLPSRRERNLRLRVSQVVEDEGMRRIPRGADGHHTYSAALKQVMQKGGAVMSQAELEARCGSTTTMVLPSKAELPTMSRRAPTLPQLSHVRRARPR